MRTENGSRPGKVGLLVGACPIHRVEAAGGEHRRKRRRGFLKAAVVVRKSTEFFTTRSSRDVRSADSKPSPGIDGDAPTTRPHREDGAWRGGVPTRRARPIHCCYPSRSEVTNWASWCSGRWLSRRGVRLVLGDGPRAASRLSVMADSACSGLEPVVEPPFFEGDLAPVQCPPGTPQFESRVGFGVEVAAGEAGSAVPELDPAVARACEGNARRLAVELVGDLLSDDLRLRVREHAGLWECLAVGEPDRRYVSDREDVVVVCLQGSRVDVDVARDAEEL
jgi:hypothetical protein